MEIIIKPRGGGKTTQLIEMCRDNPEFVIVIHNPSAMWQVYNLAKHLGVEIKKPITFEKALRMWGGRCKFLIDNVDLIDGFENRLTDLLIHNDVVAITKTE